MFDEILTIGKLSKLTGVPISTIRYYDKVGILVPAQKNKDTNYRYYTNNQIIILKNINYMRSLGFSIEFIKKHFEKMDYEYTLQLFNKLIEQTDKEINILKKIKKELKDSYHKIEKNKEIEKCIGIPFIENLENIYGELFVGPVKSIKEMKRLIKRKNEMKDGKNIESFKEIRGFKSSISKLRENIEYKDGLISIYNEKKYNKDIIIPKGKYLSVYGKGLVENGKSWNILLEYAEKNDLKLKESLYLTFSETIMFKGRENFIYLMRVEIEG